MHRSPRSQRTLRTARLFGLMVTGFGIALVAAAVLPASASGHAAAAPAKSCGNYCALPSPSTSQNRHVDGSVGNADNKNPKGQAPNGSDHNKGYECDKNKGIGNGNPAHTVNCPSPSPSRTPSRSPSPSPSVSPSPSPSIVQSVSPSPAVVQSVSPSPLAGNGGGGATAGKPTPRVTKKPVAGGGGGAGQAKVLPFTGSRTNLLFELGVTLLLFGMFLAVAARPRRVIAD